MAKMTDEELVAAIEAQEADCYGGDSTGSSELSAERADALDRYNARLYGNETSGRSQVVSSDVRDAVEALMPSLARVFLSGDELGKFEAMGPEDKAAEVESEVCNWYIFTRNDGYSQVYSAIKDALLLANGYIKVWWQTDDTVRVERYMNQTDDQLMMLTQDADVKVTEHTERQEMFTAMDPQTGQPMQQPVTLHDVKVERAKQEEYVRIAAVPPDEMRITSRHTDVCLEDCDFVQHIRRISIGELREMGYDAPDDLPSDDDINEQGTERTSRARYQENNLNDESYSNDPTRKIVTLKESWYRGDVSGTGKPELWRCCLVGSRVLSREEADHIPFATFVPSIYPHSHIGVSFYSLLSDLAIIKTTLMRQYLDNLYLVNNSEKVVNELATENLDDWLVSRPGGIKRVTGPVNEAFAQLVTPDVGSPILAGLEFIEATKENRTGIGRINQGNADPNILNRTASGAAMMMSGGQARQELICRCLATGIKDLVLLVHAIALKHSTKPLQIKLQNQWQMVDPREWAHRTDYALSVGLGTGAPEQQMAKLQALAPLVMQAAGVGMAGPEQLYNLGKEMFKAAGFRSVDKFLIQPPPGAQMPQQPNPMVLVEQEKGKVQMQIAQGKAQVDAQMAQHKAQQDAQTEQIKAQANRDKEMAQMVADKEVQQFKIQSEAKLELARHEMQMNVDQIRDSKEQETMIRKVEIESAAKIEVARITAGISDGSMMEKSLQQAAGLMVDAVNQALAPMVESIAKSAAAPKKIVRDPRTGRAVGVVPVDTTVQ